MVLNLGWKKVTQVPVFPTTDYEILRRDRKTDAHGGVFLTTKKDLIATRETDPETDCELLWCKLEIHGSKTLNIGAYYEPSENNKKKVLELQASLQMLGKNHDNVIIGGDFNFPGWDYWRNKQLKTNCNYRLLHYKFAEILNDHSMEQVVEDLTREKNVLDLFATNIPSKLNRTEVIPDVSDHCVPLMELDVSP